MRCAHLGRLDVSPDGRRLAVPGPAGLAVWDLTERRLLGIVPPGEAGEQTCAVFTPDGRRLITGGRDHAVRLWNLESEGPPHVVGRHDHPVVTAVAVSPRGGVAATGEERAVAEGQEQVLVHLWTSAAVVRPVDSEGRSDHLCAGVPARRPTLALGPRRRELTACALGSQDTCPGPDLRRRARATGHVTGADARRPARGSWLLDRFG